MNSTLKIGPTFSGLFTVKKVCGVSERGRAIYSNNKYYPVNEVNNEYLNALKELAKKFKNKITLPKEEASELLLKIRKAIYRSTDITLPEDSVIISASNSAKNKRFKAVVKSSKPELGQTHVFYEMNY